MRRTWELSRRTLLRGAGVALALPLLEAMLPTRAWSDEPEPALPELKFKPPKRPVRLCWIYNPHGTIAKEWWIDKPGPLGELTPMLKPFQPLAGELNVLSELWHPRSAIDPGPHYPDEPTFLLGTQIKRLNSTAVDVGGASIDQVVARCTGAVTRFPSLHVNLREPMAGKGSGGYSNTYLNQMSWTGPSTPVPNEIDPRRLFDRLFRVDGQKPVAPSGVTLAIGEAERISVLDGVLSEARGMRGRVGVADQRKLDEYLTAVRDVEKRLDQDLKEMVKGQRADPAAARAVAEFTPEVAAFDGRNFERRCDLMFDLFALAFWTDTTRVATFMFANMGCHRTVFYVPGVKAGYHELAHHRGDEGKKDAFRKVCLWNAERVARFLTRMQSIKEPNGGSLLDNSLVVFGSGLNDGDRHGKTNLPILLAGKGGGVVKTGRHLALPQRTPLCNLWLTMAQLAGVQTGSFSDSTKAISELG